MKGFRRALGGLRLSVDRIVAGDDEVMAWWSFAGEHVGPWLDRTPTGRQISGTVSASSSSSTAGSAATGCGCTPSSTSRSCSTRHGPSCRPVSTGLQQDRRTGHPRSMTSTIQPHRPATDRHERGEGRNSSAKTSCITCRHSMTAERRRARRRRRVTPTACNARHRERRTKMDVVRLQHPIEVGRPARRSRRSTRPDRSAVSCAVTSRSATPARPQVAGTSLAFCCGSDEMPAPRRVGPQRPS